MHIFITGVAGFLGSNLANYYLSKNFKVSGNDNMVGGDRLNVDKKVNFHEIDCENFKELKKILKGVDVVVHAAAYAHEGLSVFSPHLICANIVGGSTAVFSAAIHNKVKRIVYCSSMARYGEIQIPFKENDTPQPVDPYGISKLAAEKILINLCKIHGVEYNIAVPHNIIGENQKYDDPYRNVASIMINLMLQNKSPIIYGDGEQKRSFSDVRDCIYCLDRMITDDKIKSEIINIGPSDENYISINNLFKIISNNLKFNKEPRYFPDRPGEVKFSNCSDEKAKKILDYSTQNSVEETIPRLIDFVKKRGPKKFSYDYQLEIINDLTPETWKNKIF
jgi:UDP-glucose 4-epimerase